MYYIRITRENNDKEHIQTCIRKTIPKTPAKNPRSHNINLAGLSVPI